MKKRSLLVFIIGVFAMCISAQTAIQGKITDVPEKGIKIHLYQFFKGDVHIVDSATVTKNGKFNLKSSDTSAGFYYMRINNQLNPVVLNPKEKTLTLNSDFSKFIKGDFTYNNSKENNAYKELLRIEKSFRKTVDEVNGSIIISSIDSFHNRRKDAYREYLKIRMIKKNDLLIKLGEQYKNTFVADVLIRLSIIPVMNEYPNIAKHFDNDVAFLHYHYWDFINFNDENILRTPFYLDKINEYLSRYSDFANGMGNKSIDQILRRAKSNVQIYDVTLAMVFSFLSENKFENSIAYVINNYVNPYQFDFSENTMKFVHHFSGSAAGTTIMDQIVLNTNNTPLKLSEEYSKSEYTILYFWSSEIFELSKINQSLLNVYNNFNSRGLNIVGISLDDNADAWNELVGKFNLPWVNLIDPKGKESYILNKFQIQKLPFTVLVDKNGVIIDKNPTIEMLNKVLK